tara:strand:+ start:426 stop:605 length:180 start_codon:yes stop_codon:yes gene_type:complete
MTAMQVRSFAMEEEEAETFDARTEYKSAIEERTSVARAHGQRSVFRPHSPATEASGDCS